MLQNQKKTAGAIKIYIYMYFYGESLGFINHLCFLWECIHLTEFLPSCQKGTTLVSSFLLSCRPGTFWKRSTRKEKNLLPRSKFWLFRIDPFNKGGKSTFDRTASLGSVYITHKFSFHLYLFSWVGFNQLSWDTFLYINFANFLSM